MLETTEHGWRGALLGACLWLLASGAALATPVSLGDFDGDRLLGPQAEILEDPGATLEISDLLRSAPAWQPLADRTLSPGFSVSAWWLRIELHNDGERWLRAYLDSQSAVADYLDVYLVRDGILQASHHSGDRRPFDARPLDTHTVVVPIELAAGDSITVYLRQASWDGLHEVLNPRLLSANRFARGLQTEALALGVYYGTLIAILLYNLFLYLFTRERVFRLYLLYVGAFVAWSFILRGYGLQYLWPQAPHFNNQILPIAATICYASFGLFALEYLDIRRQAPRWLYRAYWLAIVMNLLTALPAVFGHYASAFALSLPTGILMVFIAVLSGVLMIRRGSRAAKYFLVAFSFLAIGVLLYYLQLTGAIAGGALSEYGIQLGSALEVLLLAFGLADQMNTLRADKLRAEKQARLAQLELTSKLEGEVRQRTLELQQANQRLQELATIDELTGALNRRRFNELLEAAFERHRDHRQAFALCMLDIDRFKAYNDHCGHQAGDQVLQQIARALQAGLRSPGQFLFRVGGEEFALLLGNAPTPQEAATLIESLRRDIEALAIPHPATGGTAVTASFGLLFIGAESRCERARELYARSDALLYRAKEAGRNRVIQDRL